MGCASSSSSRAAGRGFDSLAKVCPDDISLPAALKDRARVKADKKLGQNVRGTKASSGDCRVPKQVRNKVRSFQSWNSETWQDAPTGVALSPTREDHVDMAPKGFEKMIKSRRRLV
ncbi:unnamed protein product [Symbiodinium natans]|uniref:Uncharacterized protein n=1 Tax=Symbiodinium natans TaxID=878477 RepID=A0A812QES0_9DINO|nr:unnamed protein product [Symbiodinium natans]